MRDTLTRRDFLKRSGLGAALAASCYILPSSAIFGKGTASKRVNIAQVGCGGNGTGHLRRMAKMDNVRIVAAVDPKKEQREAAAKIANETYGGQYCKPVEDFRDVLADPDVDGIVVSTIDHWHVPIAVAAARAGKDMYVEKPLGLSLPDSIVLQKEIRQNGVIFQYGTQQHSSLSGCQAIDLLHNGYVGKITHCDVWSPHLEAEKRQPILPEQPIPATLNYDLWLGPAEEKPYFEQRVKNHFGGWHCYDYALGFIAGWGAHPLDMLQWGLDLEDTTPVSFNGTGYLPEEKDLMNTIRTWDIQMQYKNGVDVRFMDTVTAEAVIKAFHPYFKGNGVVYHGTEGYVVHSRGGAWVNRKGKYERVSDIDFSQFKKRALQSPSHETNFVDCMISRKDPVSTIEAAMRSDAISHLGNVAVRSGQKVKFDPKKFKITSDRSLNSMLHRKARKGYDLV